MCDRDCEALHTSCSEHKKQLQMPQAKLMHQAIIHACAMEAAMLWPALEADSIWRNVGGLHLLLLRQLQKHWAVLQRARGAHIFILIAVLPPVLQCRGVVRVSCRHAHSGTACHSLCVLESDKHRLHPKACRSRVAEAILQATQTRQSPSAACGCICMSPQNQQMTSGMSK